VTKIDTKKYSDYGIYKIPHGYPRQSMSNFKIVDSALRSNTKQKGEMPEAGEKSPRQEIHQFSSAGWLLRC
jgi:hypothetical protein